MKKLVILVITVTLYSQTFPGQDYLKKLKPYMKKFDKIEGWFDKPIINILDCINDYQKQNAIKGNIAEIGVYHGKSFVPLYLLAGNGESVLAVDVFEDQQFNYDGSGANCSFNKFMNNMNEYVGKNLEKLIIYKTDSSKMKSDDYLKKCKNNLKFRIISIDGCHRANETKIDLMNSSEALTTGGIIIVDDYFNKDWPGVSEGVGQFMNINKDLKPFFIGWNKMIFAHAEFAKAYQSVLKIKFKNFVKVSTVFDSEVIIY